MPTYSCPMHSDVQSPAPGLCARCGSDLEPDTDTETKHAATSYSCPMHPEVTEPAPGRCPKCGMYLEPET